MANVAHTARWQRVGALPPLVRSPWVVAVLRFLGALALALLGFALVLLLQGRNPVDAYVSLFASTLGTAYGRSEVVVKAIPLMLCALAVAVPARVGLVNVGGEGQLYIGAWLASWAALSFTSLSAGALIPLMFV